MGILNKLEKRMAMGAMDDKWYSPGGFFYGGTGAKTKSGAAVSELNAMQLSVVWACIKILSEDSASLPLHLYRRRKGGGKDKAWSEDLYFLMHDQPNPEMTAMSFRETYASHLLAWGNGYAEKERTGGRINKVAALWPITPNRVTVKRNEKKKLIYQINMSGSNLSNVVLQRENVLHTPGLSFNGLIGYSPIAAAREAIGLGFALEEYSELYFGQGTHPGVVVSHPNSLSPQAYSNMTKALSDAHSGLGKSHRLLLMEEGMKIEKIGIENKDAQFLECVVPGTKISMADGTICLVENLKKGDLVIGWDNGICQSRVYAVGKLKEKPIVRIKTARGRELSASFDHPCLTLKALRTPGGRKTNRNPQWIPIGNLNVGNYVRIGMGNYSKKNTMTFDHAYLLGAMTGDGYLNKQNLRFSGIDTGVINYVGKIIHEMGGELKLASKKRPHDYVIKTNGNCKAGSTIRTLFNKSGLIGKHSNDKSIPATVISGGETAWRGFLSGYFDTDGSIRDIKGRQKPSAYWSSINRKLLEECQHMLSSLGIQSSIYSMGSGCTKKIMGKSCVAQPGWGLYVMGVSQLKKMSTMLILSHVEKKRRLADYQNCPDGRYTKENFEYDRIVSIENIGIGQTIGVEIEKCHTFIANGIITHNSKKYSNVEIGTRIYRLPPQMYGEFDKASTYASAEQFSLDYVTRTLRPWLVRLEQSYNMSLLDPSDYGLYFFEHNIEGLLRGDIAARYAAYVQGKRNGFLNADEIRETENMNPIPDGKGKEYIIEKNMIGLADLGKDTSGTVQ